MRLLLRGFLVPALLALAACGPSADPGNGGTAPPEPPGDPVAEGRRLYEAMACASCHSVDGSERVGPTWQGLFGSEVTLSDGSTITADEAYLRESMQLPSARTVEGFPAGLMETVIAPGSVSAEEADALVAYIKSLR